MTMLRDVEDFLRRIVGLPARRPVLRGLMAYQARHWRELAKGDGK